MKAMSQSPYYHYSPMARPAPGKFKEGTAFWNKHVRWSLSELLCARETPIGGSDAYPGSTQHLRSLTHRQAQAGGTGAFLRQQDHPARLGRYMRNRYNRELAFGYWRPQHGETSSQ